LRDVHGRDPVEPHGRLVFAASVDQLAASIDQIMLSSAAVAATARFAPIAITGA
jgi:hypothetical protein